MDSRRVSVSVDEVNTAKSAVDSAVVTNLETVTPQETSASDGLPSLLIEDNPVVPKAEMGTEETEHTPDSRTPDLQLPANLRSKRASVRASVLSVLAPRLDGNKRRSTVELDAEPVGDE